MRPFSLLFWAVLCVLAGIVLLIRQFAPVTFQPMKIIGGLFLVLLGVCLLTPSGASRVKPYVDSPQGDVVFGDGGTAYTTSGKHDCVFGHSTVDLTSLEPGSTMEIDCVFGQCEVRLPAGTPVRVKASAAFGSVNGSGVEASGFGERNHTFEGDGMPIDLEVNAVFGQITLIR